MARGDFTLFNELSVSLAEKKINLETDTFLLALIDITITPLVDTATPQWGAGSSQDYDGNEVSTAGGYPANGLAVANPTFVRSAAVGTFDADDPPLIAQDAGGFTDAYWGILYSDTSTNKEAIGFLELAGPVSEVAGPVDINWNASGIATITRT